MSYPAHTDEPVYSHGHHEEHDNAEAADQTGFAPNGQQTDDQVGTDGFNGGEASTGALTADTDEFGTVPPANAETGDRSDGDAGLVDNESFDTDTPSDQDADAVAPHAPALDDTDGEISDSADTDDLDADGSVGDTPQDAVFDDSDAEVVNADATYTDDASVTDAGSDGETAEFVGDDAADEDIVLGDGSAADDPSVDGFAAGDVNANDDSVMGDDSATDDSAIDDNAVLTDAVVAPVADETTDADDADVTDAAAPTGLLPGEAPLANTTTAVSVDDPALHERWQQAQLSFIDDPRAATESARSIAAEALEAHISALQARQSELDSWQNDGSPDTEVLRAAMRGYRDLVDHLTS